MNTDNAHTSLGKATSAALRRSLGTRPRRWLFAITLLAGLLTTVGLRMTAIPRDQSFATLTEATQTVMSIPAPFLGALLAGDLRKTPPTTRLFPTLLAAALLAAIVGTYGILVCAVTLAVAPPGPGTHPWLHAGTVALGSVLVQTVAQLTGTALGMLLRRPAVACLATIVFPMGTWLLLSSVQSFHPAQAWLAPYATARILLSGQMTLLTWTQWIVVLLIWGVTLNTAAATWLKRRRQLWQSPRTA